jgi:hypothetical protein
MTERRGEGARVKTSRGVKLTPAAIARLADEAEAGYSPKELRRVRGRPPLGDAPSQTVQARLDPRVFRALGRRARSMRVTPSEIVRQALAEYLAK